jgi:hypothetical protein
MKLFRVRQQLVTNRLDDVAGEVRAQLDRLDLAVPQGDVAMTVGSRGIANIATIIKAAGGWLRDQGATPFIVPSMGSHNGATAAGQQQMVESLGMTEAAMDMPIRSSMECVKVGTVPTGDVWMDRYCFEADGVLVVNRVKLHTCFSGPIQSGLTKMMVVGMGKIRSAETFHATPSPNMKDLLVEMGQFLLDAGKIWAGLAILEDGHDETAELHAIPGADILQREPQLLEQHKHYFPRLPVDQLNVLIIDEIGKTYSGTGMDTNVIGHRGVMFCEDLDRPIINIIGVLRLAEASLGNAIGVGLADFITQELRDRIDEHKTFLNVYTTGDMARGKIPATLDDDRQVVEKIANRYGTQRWMFIANTLHLDQLYVSEDLCDELARNPICQVEEEPVELTFAGGKHQLSFSK